MSTATTPAPTFADAATFVSQADNEELNRLVAAINSRTRILRSLTAASVTVGATIVTSGLRPKYLNGLTGVVEAITGARADVRLDEASTNTLRYGSHKYNVNANVTNELVRGIPLSTCVTK